MGKKRRGRTDLGETCAVIRKEGDCCRQEERTRICKETRRKKMVGPPKGKPLTFERGRHKERCNPDHQQKKERGKFRVKRKASAEGGGI